MRKSVSRQILVAALVATAVAALLLPAGSIAGQRSREALAPTLRSELKELVADGVPGVVVLVRRDDRTLRLSSGSANVARKTPMRATDRFRIGSITKTFVATVVLQLVADGKLSLEDGVERWLPGLLPNGKHITVRHLLSHRSGLFNYTDDPRLLKPYFSGNFRYVWTPRRLVALSTSHKPLFPPGAKFSYSNTNYILLGLIVQAATHNSIGVELGLRIFDPLHLRSTSFDTLPRLTGAYAHGYLVRAKGQLQDVSFLSPSWAWAAGAVVSTADDVARFYRALIGGSLLRADLLRAMEPTSSEYGLGLYRVQAPCGTFWGHDGATAGYRSFTSISKDRRKQMVVLVNSLTLNDKVGSERAEQALQRLLTTALCGAG